MFKAIEKMPDSEEFDMKNPKLFISASQHYSMAKAMSMLGIGEASLKVIKTDENCRIDISLLKA